MISRVNIYFEDEKLRKDLEVYCHKHRTSFSKAVLEFTAAGFSFFQKTGSLNIDLFVERDRAKDQMLEEANKQIDLLRKIIEAKILAEPGGKTNPSSHLDVEKGNDPSRPSVDQGPSDRQEPKLSELLGKPLRKIAVSKKSE